jgi:N-acetylmuramoyl-L-alanine amidase
MSLHAELLAKKENRADIIAGANFSGASKDIMNTLIDLSQRDSMNNSSLFANIAILSVRDAEIKILQNTHRFAGFAVLTAPDMASVLIELGYLSNKNESYRIIVEKCYTFVIWKIMSTILKLI